MRIIIIMLVFELSDHTALKSVIISDNPSSYPMYHGAAWLLRLCDSCYFQSLLSSLVPCALQTQPHLAPSTGNCYNEQQNNRLNPRWFHALFRERHGPIHNSSDVKWFAKSIFTHTHKFFSACYYVQTVPTQIIRGAFSCTYIYLFLRLILLKIGNFRERY